MNSYRNSIDLRAATNTLAVISTGMFAGMTFMVGITFGQLWLNLCPVAVIANLPDQFVTILMSVLPVMFLQIFALVISLRIDWDVTHLKMLWLFSFGSFLFNGVITAVYHLPQVIFISNGKYDVTEVTAVLHNWLIFHVPRIILGLSAVYFAAKATVASSVYHQQED